jgi:hypothetical protein
VSDSTDVHLREGIRVVVEVNPTATATVDYPPPTSKCLGPPPPPEILDVAVTAVCSGETPIPYLSYVVTGSAVEPDGDVTIALFDIEGNQVRPPQENRLPTDRTVYPGASADPPDWPGWAIDGAGQLVVDPSDWTLRDGGEFVVSVGDSLSDSVAYPAVPEECEPGSPEPPPPAEVRVTPACRSGIPVVRYEIEVSGDSSGSVGLTFTDLDGNTVGQFSDQPLTGSVEYPGASQSPRDWPGWVKTSGGDWVRDPSDRRLGDGGVLEVEIGPTLTASVAYPATPCDGPIPSLILEKEVLEDVGGTAQPGDFTLTATGFDPGSPQPGTYALAWEGPDGYEVDSLTCTNSSSPRARSVTLRRGEPVTCTLVVRFVADVSLTLDAQIFNDNGGTLELGDLEMSAEGFDEERPEPGTYRLEYVEPPHYTLRGPKCTNRPDPSGESIDLDIRDGVTLRRGDHVTCFFKYYDNEGSGGSCASADSKPTVCGVLSDSVADGAIEYTAHLVNLTGDELRLKVWLKGMPDAFDLSRRDCLQPVCELTDQIFDPETGDPRCRPDEENGVVLTLARFEGRDDVSTHTWTYDIPPEWTGLIIPKLCVDTLDEDLVADNSPTDSLISVDPFEPTLIDG